VLGHGTFSAGLIGGYRSGDVGIQGVAPGTALYDVQVLEREQNGATSTAIVAGIEWAIVHGIQVLNLGVGSRVYDPIEEDAYRRACQAGVVLVAAAGNTDSHDREVMFPARYPTALAVTAVGRIEDAVPGEDVAVSTDGRFFFPRFNCCGDQVDLAAPGVEICSILPTMGDGRVLYEYGTGTSEAACFVSAAAAVVLATHPELTRERGPRLPRQCAAFSAKGHSPWDSSPLWRGQGC
jgi:subtilisin